MPDYRRLYRPGGTYFFTIVTRHRNPILEGAQNVGILREAVRTVRNERPFEVCAAVILPDHVHFIWALPEGDTAYAARIGRVKILFTQFSRRIAPTPADLSGSADRHRESGYWQRRYWEHVIRDEDDFQHHLDYIHYNPVKHRYVGCPHAWPHSSFRSWVGKRVYERDWLCKCGGGIIRPPTFDEITRSVGE